MTEIITISEAATLLGYKKISEAESWLKWYSVSVINIAQNSFLKRKDLESAIQRIIDTTNGEDNHLQNKNKKSQDEKPQHIYNPEGKERAFYNKLIKTLDEK